MHFKLYITRMCVLMYSFSSYGEGMFMAIQTSLVMFLVIYFSGNMLGAFLFLTLYGLSMSFLDHQSQRLR